MVGEDVFTLYSNTLSMKIVICELSVASKQITLKDNISLLTMTNIKHVCLKRSLVII